MLRAAIFRLESYLEYLTFVKASGKTTITSEELAAVVGLSSSRVRQDLTHLQVIGKPRSGYDVTELEILLYSELDLLTEKGMALIGCGNLGRALIHSGIWDHTGFSLRAIFDNDINVVGQDINGLTVRHIRELHGVVKSENIISACITVPDVAAQSVANLLVGAGIKGLWNFAPVDIKVPADVVVENQRLEQGLMTLSYLISKAQKPQGKSTLLDDIDDPGGVSEKDANDTTDG